MPSIWNHRAIVETTTAQPEQVPYVWLLFCVVVGWSESYCDVGLCLSHLVTMCKHKAASVNYSPISCVGTSCFEQLCTTFLIYSYSFSVAFDVAMLGFWKASCSEPPRRYEILYPVCIYWAHAVDRRHNIHEGQCTICMFLSGGLSALGEVKLTRSSMWLWLHVGWAQAVCNRISAASGVWDGVCIQNINPNHGRVIFALTVNAAHTIEIFQSQAVDSIRFYPHHWK